jgi:hypothetical protein
MKQKVGKIPISSVNESDINHLWLAYWDNHDRKANRSKTLAGAILLYGKENKLKPAKIHRLLSVAATLAGKIRFGQGFMDMLDDPESERDYYVYMSKPRKSIYSYDASGHQGNGQSLYVLFSSVELKGCQEAEIE